VLSASTGDTILVGPGRYTDVAPFSLPGWTHPTYIAVEADSLVIIGEDRDSVIIGPEVPNVVGFGPKGIATQANVTMLTLRSLTFEHVRDGAYFVGRTEIADCAFLANVTGIVSFNESGLSVNSSEFVGNTDGIGAFHPANGIVVSGTRFSDGLVGVGTTVTSDVLVESCEFSRLAVGVEYDRTSPGSVVNSTFESCQNTNVNFISGSLVRMEGCTAGPSQWSIRVEGSGTRLTGSGNKVAAGAASTIRFVSNATAEMHGNDLLLQGDRSIELIGTYDEVSTIDLTDNYWGTADIPAIAERIWDGNDDPRISAIVDYEPVRGRSIPTSRQSIGQVKSRH